MLWGEGHLLVEEELLALSILVYPFPELLVLDENVVRSVYMRIQRRICSA
jgi:hypothetical protein